jgi:hypothetical protein
MLLAVKSTKPGAIAALQQEGVARGHLASAALSLRASPAKTSGG